MNILRTLTYAAVIVGVALFVDDHFHLFNLFGHTVIVAK